ncbi:MAG: hypothetical protein MKZ95_14805, partial [Pirellulales bacterium]|nr:hypothetical protein [Pirellulales bacterium]
HQGLVERLVGVGTVCIRSSDQSHPKIELPGIEDVNRIADMIDGVRRHERLKRGLHVESVLWSVIFSRLSRRVVVDC